MATFEPEFTTAQVFGRDNSTEFEWNLPKYNTGPEAYIVPIVFGLIFIIGVVGNGILIYTVLKNKKMRNVPNILIVSLACGDLLLILVSVPFTATIYTLTSWNFGVFMCKLNMFLETWSLGVSVFTLTALSGDRYMAIMNPKKTYNSKALIKTLCIAGGIWGLAFVLAIPDAVTSNVVNTKVGITYCDPYPYPLAEWYIKLHVLGRLFVYYLFPATIIGVLYTLMAQVLLHGNQQMPGDFSTKGGQEHQLMETRKKVAKVVLSFVVIFIVCWLPRHIYLVWYHLNIPGRFTSFWAVFKVMGFCLAYINSCINPLALYFLSRQFRRYYNKYLLCCCAEKGGPSEEDESHSETMDDVKSHKQRAGDSLTGVTAANDTVC